MLIRACVVSDSPELAARLEKILRQPDLIVSRPPEGAFHACVEGDSFDLVIASEESIPRPYSETVAVLGRLPDRPDLVALLSPGQREERAALQAAGAFAVVDRDLPEPSLRKALSTLVRRRREAAVARLREAPPPEPRVAGATGSERSSMTRLLELAGRVADGASSVLIVGETGVGKEWLARWIHERSPRAAGSFVAVNCAALPAELVESELFGHEQGAFTGAHRAQFEIAHQGTLFLDEIAEMPAASQAKLLRAIQDREIRRVGSERPIRVDVRILAATNRNPEEAIRSKHLREDLYYRLGVVTLEVPPLRDRSEDVPALAQECLAELEIRLHRPDLRGIAPAALDALRRYRWPGNVRELLNVLERAVLLAEGPEITLGDLPVAVARPPGGGPRDVDGPSRPRVGWESFWEHTFDAPLAQATAGVTEEYEREYLRRLLERTGGRIGEAARRAGVDQKTLYAKMRRYEMDKRVFRAT